MSLSFITYPQDLQQPQTLFVLLHGWGANHQDLVSIAAGLHLPHCQFLFPNAPFPHPHAPNGRMWYNLETDPLTLMPTIPWFQDGTTDKDDVYLQRSRGELTEWLLSLATITGVPLTQTLLAGFSQGGAMALDVGVDLGLAGVISCSGYWHRSTPPENRSADRRGAPVLMIHGKSDPVIPLRAAYASAQQLQRSGILVDFVEYGMGHEIQLLALKRMQQFAESRLLLLS
ncbi:MAG: alpha/beta hydrolase [Synechococcales bacterium]|nr:alpha/beta hydrolase [Cyanobacteria bacterium REEB444]MEB3125211.1 alpha/beta hydrolase [Synechococcales bacterium]